MICRSLQASAQEWRLWYVLLYINCKQLHDYIPCSELSFERTNADESTGKSWPTNLEIYVLAATMTNVKYLSECLPNVAAIPVLTTQHKDLSSCSRHRQRSVWKTRHDCCHARSADANPVDYGQCGVCRRSVCDVNGSRQPSVKHEAMSSNLRQYC